jgi:hypothetical protein
MRIYHGRLIRSTKYISLLMKAGCGVLTLFLFSCGTTLNVQNYTQQKEIELNTTQFSIIFYIHGDGDYLYHDNAGNELNADDETLTGAIRVAQQNPNSEVFIFHQKPSKHFLFFFPLRDGDFYYYRNGRLIANESYWCDEEISNFDVEAELYDRFKVNNQRKMINMFLYFGHEIPEFGGAGYDVSYRDRTFTVHDLAGGMKLFTTKFSKFDLVVLSTCFGGTPYTIGTLGQFSKTIIASPDNLHLTYFDLHLMERLDINLQDGDVAAFAKRFAQHAFERLTKNIQTAVSVVVYDVERVQKYLQSINEVYDRTITYLKEETQFPTKIEHCDCADISAYKFPTMDEGIDVFFRSARFGRLKNKQKHSGWECWNYEGPGLQSGNR